MKKGLRRGFCLLLISLLCVSFASAGMFSFFGDTWDKLTSQVQMGPGTSGNFTISYNCNTESGSNAYNLEHPKVYTSNTCATAAYLTSVAKGKCSRSGGLKISSVKFSNSCDVPVVAVDSGAYTTPAPSAPTPAPTASAPAVPSVAPRVAANAPSGTRDPTYAQFNTPTKPTPSTTASSDSNTCTDSDGGKDYYVKGTTSGKNPFGFLNIKSFLKRTQKLSDTCEIKDGVSTGYLFERYCNAKGYVETEKYLCEDGCKDGKCIKSFSQVKTEYENYFDQYPKVKEVLGIGNFSENEIEYFWDYIYELESNKNISVNSIDFPTGWTELSESEVSRIRLAFVTYSIWTDKNNIFLWKLNDYNEEDLSLLIGNVRSMDELSTNSLRPQNLYYGIGASSNFYWFDSSNFILNSSPNQLYSYVSSCKKGDRKKSIYCVLKYIEDFRHLGFDTDDVEYYNTNHPFSLDHMLNYRDRHGFRITPVGCQSTAQMITYLTQILNIPARYILALPDPDIEGHIDKQGNILGGHGGIYWPSEQLVVLHADDLYTKMGTFDNAPKEKITTPFNDFPLMGTHLDKLLYKEKYFRKLELEYPSSRTIVNYCTGGSMIGLNYLKNDDFGHIFLTDQDFSDGENSIVNFINSKYGFIKDGKCYLNKCIDLDKGMSKGMDYYANTQVLGLGKDGSYQYKIDECQDQNTLIEYYCKDLKGKSIVSNVLRNCENGCDLGACKI